jgi:hypothetical protein
MIVSELCKRVVFDLHLRTRFFLCGVSGIIISVRNLLPVLGKEFIYTVVSFNSCYRRIYFTYFGYFTRCVETQVITSSVTYDCFHV